MSKIIYHQDEPRKFNSNCPLCNSQIKWQLASGTLGSVGTAICTKSVKASQIITNLHECPGCEWEGFAVRQKNGGIRFKNKNGTWLREHVIANSRNG